MSETTQQEPAKRPQFGNRFLSGDNADEDVFKHNAW